MHILAGEGRVPPATAAVAARAAEPADAGALPDCPAMNLRSNRVDDADHLMAGNARILDAGKKALDGDGIAVADAAGLHADAHLAGARLGHLALHRLELPPDLRDDHRAHLRHVLSSLAVGRERSAAPGAGKGAGQAKKWNVSPLCRKQVYSSTRARPRGRDSAPETARGRAWRGRPVRCATRPERLPAGKSGARGRTRGRRRGEGA